MERSKWKMSLGISFEVGYDLSELDIETLRAGGTLNLIRSQQ